MIAKSDSGTQFYRALYDLRTARALTQQEVADKMSAVSGLNWNSSSLSRLETGSREPHPETILTLADAFELEGLERFRFFAAAQRWEEVPPSEALARMYAVIEDETEDAA